MAILQKIYSHEPQRLAGRAGNTLITYGRLCSDIDGMAHWLLGDHGLKPGERVSLHVKDPGNPDYWEWIMHLAAIRAGLVQSTDSLPAPLATDPALPPYAAAIGHLDKLPDQAAPARKIAFAPPGNAPLSEQIAIKPSGRSLDGLERHAGRLLSTSGTTGRPKGILWNAELLDGRLEQVRAIGDIRPDTVILTLLGMLTTTGLRYPIAAWQIGATVLLTTIGEQRANLADLSGMSTFLATSPFRMQQILRLLPNEWPGKANRTIELFGGRVPPLLRQKTLAHCCTALRMSYGATEVGRVAAGDAALVDRDSGAVGMVEPGIVVEIIGPDGNPCPAGQPGTVRMRSQYMARGYIGLAPEAAAETPFRDGWFYPGDLGVLYEDGLFAITGRTAETINVSGAKISPIPLEERIGALPEVEDVCILSLQMDASDILAAATVCSDDVDLELLRRKMQPLVPRQFPFVVVRVTSIPRNAMGRIPRAQVSRSLERSIRKNMGRRKAKTPTPQR